MLDELLLKYSNLHKNIDSILTRYKTLYNTNNVAYQINKSLNKADDKKEMKKLEKQYLKFRNDIEIIEDEIYSVDKKMIDEIVKPLPEDIKEFFI